MISHSILSDATTRQALHAALEAEPSSAYVLSADLRLLHVNTAWSRFARENGAPELADGWSSLSALPESMGRELRDFFVARLERVLTEASVWSHIYECSSPAVYRKFNMRVKPAPSGEGLVVVHSIVEEIRLKPGAPLRDFSDARGMIVRCAACGRVRRSSEPPSWQWVPGLETERTDVSHGICAICEFQHYGA